MAETIPTNIGGHGPLLQRNDRRNVAGGDLGIRYRMYQPRNKWDSNGNVIEVHDIESDGILSSVDFTTTGIYALAPVGSTIRHTGTSAAAPTTPFPCHLVRMTDTNGTDADWWIMGTTPAAITTEFDPAE